MGRYLVRYVFVAVAVCILATAGCNSSAAPDPGLAIELLGDGGNVEFVNALIANRTTFTIEFWIKPVWPPIVGAGVDGRNVFYCESYTEGGALNGATRNFIWIGSDDPDNAFDEFGAATLSNWPGDRVPSVFTLPLAETVWQHLAFVREGAELRIYVNGALHATGPAITYTGPVPNRFHLGLRVNPVSGPEWCRAVIDELRISSTARYASDFNPGVVLAADGDTLSLWHFDEAAGSTTADETGSEPDATLSPTAMRVLADR